jgi:hypothetical protein
LAIGTFLSHSDVLGDALYVVATSSDVGDSGSPEWNGADSMTDPNPLNGENTVIPDLNDELIDVGDAADLTEGTSTRSGTEDKRYKYQ